jgi:hypothetical protein
MQTGFFLLLLFICCISISCFHPTLRTIQAIRPISTSLSLKNGNQQKNNKNEDMDIELDINTLNQEEQTRIRFLRKLAEDANRFLEEGGLPVPRDDDDREEIEREVIDTKWSGQSNVEVTKISRNNPIDIFNRPGLYFGDVLSILLFAIIGKANHAEDLSIFSLLETAGPFLLTWSLVSSFVGAYTRKATASYSAVFTSLLPGWFLGISSGLIFRGFLKGYIPPTPFIIVSLISTFVLLLLWRTFYVFLLGNTSDEEYRQAGVLEVFKMITTLVRRW